MKNKDLLKFYNKPENQKNIFVKPLYNGDHISESLIFLSGEKFYIVGGFYPVFSISLTDESFKIRFNKLNPLMAMRYQKANLELLFPDKEIVSVLFTNRKMKDFQFYDEVHTLRRKEEVDDFFSPEKPNEILAKVLQSFKGFDDEHAMENVEIDSLEIQRSKYYVKQIMKGARQ